MAKRFKSALELSDFLTREREQALIELSKELSCDLESLSFIFKGEDYDAKEVQIPCRREALV